MGISRWNLWLLAACVAALLFSCVWWYAFSPPRDFPTGSIVTIAQGASAPEISELLADAHVIKHPGMLRLLFRISGTSAQVQSGAYLFPSPQNLLVVAYRLITSSYGIPPVRITFIEGTTVREMAEQIAQVLPEISVADFTREAKSYEGYLFPDTYLFTPSASALSIVATMRENFNTKIASSSRDIAASGHSLSDIVIIASLVEKEARTDTNKLIVSGILWNRLEL
jgi:UPF0755 protein